jgi:hypothetical protein
MIAAAQGVPVKFLIPCMALTGATVVYSTVVRRRYADGRAQLPANGRTERNKVYSTCIHILEISDCAGPPRGVQGDRPPAVVNAALAGKGWQI